MPRHDEEPPSCDTELQCGDNGDGTDTEEPPVLVLQQQSPVEAHLRFLFCAATLLRCVIPSAAQLRAHGLERAMVCVRLGTALSAGALPGFTLLAAARDRGRSAGALLHSGCICMLGYMGARLIVLPVLREVIDAVQVGWPSFSRSMVTEHDAASRVAKVISNCKYGLVGDGYDLKGPDGGEDATLWFLFFLGYCKILRAASTATHLPSMVAVVVAISAHFAFYSASEYFMYVMPLTRGRAHTAANAVAVSAFDYLPYVEQCA